MKKGVVTLRFPFGQPTIAATYTGPYRIEGFGVWLNTRLGQSQPVQPVSIVGNPITDGDWLFVPGNAVLAISSAEPPDE